VQSRGTSQESQNPHCTLVDAYHRVGQN
jgi:hypothetical protein